MDSKSNPMDESMDWNDMSMFNTSQFDDGMPAESPFGNSAFNDFTNLDAFDSPAGLMLRTPSKSGPEVAAVAGAQDSHHVPNISSASAESSSQDSASDSSSRRKRKTNNSESPASDQTTEPGKTEARVRQTDSKMMIGDMQQGRHFENTFSQPMHNLSLEHGMSGGADSNMSQFDFNSAASSPIQTGDFNTAMSLDAHVNMPTSSVTAQFQDSPVQTINPGMFTIGGSRDQSPATNNMMFNQPSPNAIFSTPSSDSQDFANPGWNAAIAQNPAWPGDYANQLASPAGMTFTPSPAPNGSTPAASNRMSAKRMGRSPLHIAPISTKSRVETQINVVMSLEKPPPGLEQLHLPLHTIAKSKLLAKEEHEKAKVLELHTMLVCSSAMHNPQCKEKALLQAAAANNDEIQRRAELARETSDEEKNDPKNVDEADKPANGGEVKICSNCIQRERKRAGRKKTKREEEQQHWERFETERVVVFNSNEYLPFKPCDPAQIPQREGDAEPYVPPEGALCVTAAMRIACYCRHQSEKEGFQVIFTLKDHYGNVVAQQISDSILITDDHKTHPPSFPTSVSNDGFYQGTNYLPNGLPMSHSMVDMTAHTQPFTSSRSAGNLQSLYDSAQFNSHSHIHQLPGSGYASGTTSATMTPTSLSRPASPSSAGQAGPNKKRKSSTFHRKVPSGLTMTPRVDTSQAPSSNMPSAMSMGSQFSPTSAAFGTPLNPSYMTIPNNNGPAQYFGSGPSTPNESGPFSFGQPQVDLSRMTNNQAYFSHPSSAVPSRSSSPVLQQTRANMAAYARQQPIQTPTNSINARPTMFAGQAAQAAAASEQGSVPSITRITPNEGPVSGGTEVAILGENFVMGMSIAFGEQVVQTSWVSSTSLLAISPPSRAGSVHIGMVPPQGQVRYPEPASKPIFRYIQNNDEMMVMALKFLSEQHQGTIDNWQSFAQQSATNFVQSRVTRAGLQQQGYPAGYRMAAGPEAVESFMLRVFDAVDLSESPELPSFDLASAAHGGTMLSLSCSLGMQRVVAALLARGANVDVRDRLGYTPLMHAALHGRAKIFQLLVSRGADPTIRSLSGCAALDVAPVEMRNQLAQILLSTRRRRHSRPPPPTYASYGSTASSSASWDIASASFYESECDEGERKTFSSPSSRHSSRQSSHCKPVMPSRIVRSPVSPASAMAAWRKALVAQIHQFQETLNWNVHNLQLSPLPDLTSCRRLSSFVQGTLSPTSTNAAPSPEVRLATTAASQGSHDTVLSSEASSLPSSPPPAYHDLFPDTRDLKPSSESKRAMQNTAVQTALIDAVADEKCAWMFKPSDGTSSTTANAFSRCTSPSKADDAFSAWLSVTLLAVASTIVVHLILRHLCSVTPLSLMRMESMNPVLLTA